ncbi:hypothetical protein PCK1_001214 [Pneumocystis canis]|nr:hypothetical protein PCK1_001214 [Pneumocystis canis]
MTEISSECSKPPKKSFEKGYLLVDLILNNEEFSVTRLPSLYSDFSLLKNSNPEGFKANVSAWKYALQEAVWTGKITWSDDYLVIHCDNKLLVSLYTSKYGTPLGLMETMEDALKNGEWMLLNYFFKKKKSLYTYPFFFVSHIFIWGLQKIGLLGQKHRRLNESCVILQHVECAANALLALVQDRTMYTEHIYTFDALITSFSDKVLHPRVLSKLDMKIIVHYLSFYRKEISTNENYQVIKLRSTTHNFALAVNETDMLVSKLKTLRDQLRQLTETLSQNVKQVNDTIKTAVKMKNKALALFHLRSRKNSESTLNKRLQALEQIEEILCKIDEAAIQMDILNSMKGGANVLESLMKAMGGIKTIEDIMEKAKMLSCDLKDIGKVLNEINLSDISDIQIEEEFEALLNSLNKEDIKEAAADATSQLLSCMDSMAPSSNPCNIADKCLKKAIKVVE